MGHGGAHRERHKGQVSKSTQCGEEHLIDTDSRRPQERQGNDHRPSCDIDGDLAIEAKDWNPAVSVDPSIEKGDHDYVEAHQHGNHAQRDCDNSSLRPAPFLPQDSRTPCQVLVKRYRSAKECQAPCKTKDFTRRTPRHHHDQDGENQARQNLADGLYRLAHETELSLKPSRRRRRHEQHEGRESNDP